ncbi:MAG: SRPBCC family protein [Anaerolineae bacterium]|jgi:ribosome-associated toxin RatA of RatAB toxin-antitoxin module|nr:SRPBCC family protein [Anaerolineae bacterium]
MPSVTETVDIHASPRMVFNYVWDATSLPTYFPTSKVEVLQSSESRVTVRHDLQLEDRTVEVVCVREALAAGRTITFRATEGMVLEGNWTFVALKDSTRVTFIMSYEAPGGFMQKMRRGRKTDQEMQSLCSGCLQRLKAAIEAQARAA